MDNVGLWWRWRRKTSIRTGTLTLNILVPLFFVVISVSATLLTSLAVTASNIQVLVQSPWCTQYDQTTDHAVPKEYFDRASIATTSYRDTCYREGVSTPSLCNNIFVKPRLPLTVSNSSCPFHDSVCQNGAINLDTGYLDLRNDFGVNHKKGDGVKFRKQTTCAVLPYERFCKVVKNTEVNQQWRYTTPLLHVGDNYVNGMNLLIGFFGPRTGHPISNDSHYQNATVIMPIIPDSRVRGM